MKNIYHKVTKESGLSVSISQNGITISELTNVKGLIEDLSQGSWLIITNTFTWKAWANRFRDNKSCYSGDTGEGKMKNRIIAGAISLLAYWGGEETFIHNKKDFKKAE